MLVRLIRDVKLAFKSPVGIDISHVYHAGSIGFAEKVSDDTYVLTLHDNMYIVKPVCTSDDFEQIPYEEVIGVVIDVEYGHYKVNNWDMGIYEGKKVRVRIEVID